MFNIGFAIISAILFGAITLKQAKTKTAATDLTLGQFDGLISVVVPARNEESRIGLLLESLAASGDQNFETIVVDDMSEDRTCEIASGFGVNVIKIDKLKSEFRGKTNACEIGFQHSIGKVIVFLDADTFVHPNFMSKVRELFSHPLNQVVTIQPKSKCVKLFEQLSLFFHISSVTATGVNSLFPFGFGLYGPCIAMRREAYVLSHGFANENVRKSIVEDVALGEVLEKQNIAIARYAGSGLIQYRMYEKFSTLYLGWKRNIAAGFTKAPILPSIILVMFYGSLISLPVQIIQERTPLLVAIFIFELILLFIAGLKLGNYLLGIIFYPLTLFFFMVVFFASLTTRILRLKTSWAGRKLEIEKK